MKGFRDRLGVSEPASARPLAPGEGLDGAGWAQEELGGARLGDRRLSQRLVSIASIKGHAPGMAFSEAVEGRAAPTAGFYRFLDQPDEPEVSMDNMLAPHRARTLRRMREQGRMLCVHDTTDLNYSTLLGREAPNLPVEVLFDNLQIRVLTLVSRQNGWPAPASLADAVVTVARMGGYINRMHDPPPGAELLWRGYRHLTLLSQGLALASSP